MNAVMNTAPPLVVEAPVLRQTITQRLTAFMRRQHWITVIIWPVLLSIGMGWLDNATTWELSLFVFYAVPVLMAAWWIGSHAGMFMAVFCGVVWWFANESTHPYETTLGYAWATVSRMIFFAVVSYATTSVRKRQEADAARIHDLEERRQLEADLVAVSEHEQQRIGQDLHDGLCQHLAAIGLAARSLSEDLKNQSLPGAQDAEMIHSSIHEAVNEARSLARGIFPVHVDRHGLTVALGELAQNTSRLTGVKIEVQDEGDTQISPPEAAMHLYRIAQEAVGNAVRHGGAQHVLIRLGGDEGFIVLTIVDDGQGFQVQEQGRSSSGMGLRTMRYRAQVLGARLHINPVSGGGTSVRCVVPVTRS